MPGDPLAAGPSARRPHRAELAARSGCRWRAAGAACCRGRARHRRALACRRRASRSPCWSSLRPLPGQHGLQPGDPDRPRRRSPTTGAIRYLQSQAAGPLRGPATRAGADHAAADRRTWRCATASTTRAATTIPSRSATTSSGGRRSGRRELFSIADHRVALPTAAALRALSLLSVSDLIQRPDASRRSTARAPARLLAGPTPASTATRPRCRGRSSWTASGRSSGEDAALAATMTRRTSTRAGWR